MCARKRMPHQLEIPVGRERSYAQRNFVTVVVPLLDIDRVIAALDLAHRKAGIEFDMQRDGITQRLTLRHDRRRNARCVRHLVCIRRPARALWRVRVRRFRLRRARNVARADDGRKTQTDRGIFVAQRLLIFDFHGQGLARSEIRHAAGKDVGAFLLHERRPAAAIARRLVFGARLGALTDLPFDLAISHLHAQAVHSGVLRQGKNVDAFDPVRRIVLELLRDHGPRDHAAHRDFHVGAQHGRADQAPGRTHAHQKTAAGLLARLLARCSRHRVRIGGGQHDCARGLRWRRNHGQRQNGQCQQKRETGSRQHGCNDNAHDIAGH